MNKRHSGILLHITSLPSMYGIGDMGPSAYAFVDFAVSCGQKYWQILPINPTDGINGHSPYSCSSAFAGNELLISPELMVAQGFLQAQDIKPSILLAEKKVEYAAVQAFKEKLFNLAYRNFLQKTEPDDFYSFVKEHGYWLEDFALFMVIKSVHHHHCWNEWPQGLKTRRPKALKAFADGHAVEIKRIQFIQYLFFRQWHKLKRYVHDKGMAIIGDIPIYVNYDSVEVWRHPSLFKIDSKGQLKFVSGCPPDYFSRTGQRWGNPVYNWAQLKKVKYAWWVNRVAHNLRMFDYLRIDHFRGFASFWQIPARERLAVFGAWVKGPGADFFNVLVRHFKNLPIIAEDLGEITPDVLALMKQFHFPGMRVLLFAFNGDKHNAHNPANYPSHVVAYSGTHDNNTVRGWYHQEAKAHEKAHVARVVRMKFTARDLHWVMIEALMKSKAQTVIIPMADFLGLREEGRMNTPATMTHNWQWRLKNKALTSALARKILKIITKTHRS